MSWAAVRLGGPRSDELRASGRTAQTAATQGTPVRVRHSRARSNHWQGPMVASICSRDSRARSAGSPIRMAASACCSIATGSAAAGTKAGLVLRNLRKSTAAYARELRGGGVGCNSLNRAEGVRRLDDKLNRADFVERPDGASRNDSEFGCQRRDGNEAEVCACGPGVRRRKVKAGCSGGCSVVQAGGERWMLEVPHERSGIEEVDGSDAKHLR